MDENVLFLIVIYIVDVVLYIISFAWMIMCDKLTCKCVSENKRNIIRIFLFFLSLLLIFSSLYILLKIDQKNNMKYFIMICQLIYIIVLFSYLRDIIRKRCDCKKGSNEKNYNRIDIGLLAFFGIVILYLTFIKLFF